MAYNQHNIVNQLYIYIHTYKYIYTYLCTVYMYIYIYLVWDHQLHRDINI